MPNLRSKVINGIGWAFVLRVLNSLTVLAVNMLVVRMLSPADVGLYLLAVSFVSFANCLGSFGLHIAVVRLIAESLSKGVPERVVAVVRKVAALAVGNGVLVMCLISFGGLSLINSWFYHSEELVRNALLIGLWTLAWVMQKVVAEIFRGFNNIKLAILFRQFFPNVCFVFFLIFVLFRNGQADYQTILWGTAGSWLTSLGFSLFPAFKKLKTLPRTGGASYKVIAGLAWPIGITDLLTIGMVQVDIWILGAFVEDFDEIAVYGVVVRLLRQAVFPLFIITAVIQPIIVGLYTENKMKELQSLLRGVSTAATGLGMCVLAWCFLIGDWTLELLFGKFYASGADILMVISLGTFLRIFDNCNQMTLMMTGNGRTAMIVSVLYSCTIVVGGILIVPVYGPIGMAWIMVAAALLRTVLHVFFVKIKTGVSPLPSFNPHYLKLLFRSGDL